MIIVRTERLLAAAATLAGLVAWIVLLRADLVLSHYDAKAHLVVARRVIDNTTPGWQQIGAVWLPLPHLIHLLPTQIDFFYRTGAFASLVSVLCFGICAFAAARLVMLITGSQLGATVSVALLALNPNLLYLQATPMTEPLLLAATFLVILWLYEWVPTQQDHVPARLGLALFAASWTRYEAWPVIGAALMAALYASARLGGSRQALIRRAWRLGLWPAAAVLLFVVNSRLTVGEWFVTGGFYVPDPAYEGRAVRSLLAIWWGTHQLSTRVTELIALAAAAVFVGRALLRRADAALLVPAALFAAAALPFYAFYEGHPFRIRYMVPIVAACALFGGLGVGVIRRYASLVLAGLLIGIMLLQSPPWWQGAPMLVEAQWDRPASQGRRAVTACLAPAYTGGKILASMGSLAHYMQELSRDGFTIADFIHEGNGVIWQFALETGPAPHAGWMLVEEQAEGGDVLAQRIRRDPGFTRGMQRICDGGGVALYRRAR
ncbi:MAG: hypothetical protein EXQ59_05665 [Acidobacteria bacterium]|nr:hypothetical protein [Acidobacteriota bacterium]